MNHVTKFKLPLKPVGRLLHQEKQALLCSSFNEEILSSSDITHASSIFHPPLFASSHFSHTHTHNAHIAHAIAASNSSRRLLHTVFGHKSVA